MNVSIWDVSASAASEPVRSAGHGGTGLGATKTLFFTMAGHFNGILR